MHILPGANRESECYVVLVEQQGGCSGIPSYAAEHDSTVELVNLPLQAKTSVHVPDKRVMAAHGLHPAMRIFSEFDQCVGALAEVVYQNHG